MSSHADTPGQAPIPPAPRATVAGLDPAQTADRGARVKFIEQEAENALTTGTVIGPDTALYTLAGEASGRAAVMLDAPGQYVEFTLTAAANAITIRYSIPDAPAGGGIEAPITVTVTGAEPRSVTLTSRYSWFYGIFPYTNDPAYEPAPGAWKPEPDPVGKPFRPSHFYDEVRVLLGRTHDAGDRLRLSVPEGSPAAWYAIDLVDFELVDPPAPAPDGSVSVVDFGADPTGALESSDAFDDAIAAARIRRAPVFIPTGTFQVNRHITVDEVTIRGAGSWWSIVRGRQTELPATAAGPSHTGVGFYGRRAEQGGSSNVHLADFAIEGDVRERIDRDRVNGVGGALSHSSVTGLYIHHVKVGVWVDGPLDDLTIRNTIIADVTADGINFCHGVTNSRVVDCFIRNTGDDGLAMWSRSGVLPDGSTPENAGNVFERNTVQTPLLANGIAIYGGRDNVVSANLVADPMREGGGLHAGQRFKSTPFAGRLVFRDNLVLRAGVFETRWEIGLGAIWFYAQEGPIAAEVTVEGDRYLDSIHHAILILSEPAGTPGIVDHLYDAGLGTGDYPVSGLRFEGVTIGRAGGAVVSLHCAGSATFRNVLASGIGAPGVDSAAGFEIVDLGGNESWLGGT
jgi:hypothetical protein